MLEKLPKVNQVILQNIKYVSISELAKQKCVRVKLYRKPDRSDEPNPLLLVLKKVIV